MTIWDALGRLLSEDFKPKYLFRPERAADDLQAGRFSAGEKFAYFFLWLTMIYGQTLFRHWLYSGPEPRSDYPTIAILIQDWVGGMIILAGYLLAFVANQRGDGKDFIERSVILSIPVWFNTGLLYFPIILFIVILEETLKMSMTWTNVAVHVTACLVVSRRLRFAMKLASESPGSENN